MTEIMILKNDYNENNLLKIFEINKAQDGYR